MESGQRGPFLNMLLADEGAASEPAATYTQQEQLQLRESVQGGSECLSGGLFAHQLCPMREVTNHVILLSQASAGLAHAAQAGLGVAAAPTGFQGNVDSLGSSRLIPLTSTGSPLQPSASGSVLWQQQQQQQQQHPGQQASRHALLAPAGCGTPTFQMYRAPPYTTDTLVTTGDQLLQEYQDPAFLRAIQLGRYVHHIPLLEKIWDYIQSVQLLPAAGDHPNITAVVQQVSSSLPAPGSAATAAGAGMLMPQHFWSVPPAISGSSRTRAAAPRQMMTEPASTLTAAAAGPDSATGTSAACNEFVARNFGSYTSATPIAIGGDRYLVQLKQADLGPLSDQYPRWGFRMWVCAVRLSNQQQGQQQQATVPTAAAATAATAEAGAEFPCGSYMFSEEAPSPYPDPCTDITEGISLAGLEDLLAPQEAAAAVAAITVDEGTASSPAVAAGGTVADAGSAVRWPYNPSHASVGIVEYDRDRKKAQTAARGAAAAAAGVKQKAAKPRRRTPAASGAQDGTCDTYLLDVSVGWCVFAHEPPRQQIISSSSERSQQHIAKRSRSSSSMDWTTATTGAAAAAAAAGDGSSPSSSLGLAALQISTDGGPAQASHHQAPAASATNQQHVAGMAVPPPPPLAAATTAPAVDDLTALLHQLEVQATGWTPKRLLSWFQPPSDDAPAAGGTPHPSVIDSIREALLQQDVRDKHGRNVLHIVASCKPGRFQESPAAAAAVTIRLDTLLGFAALQNKLMCEKNDNGSTALMVAAAFGVPEVYNRLLAAADMHVLQSTTNAGWSVLHRLAHSAQQAASDREAWQRFQQCIDDTIKRVVELAIGLYTSPGTVTATSQYHQQQQRDRLRSCCEWVTRVINLPEPTDRHYQGAQAMRETDVSRKAQELLQIELSRLGVQL